jgi:regulatory protein
VPHYKKSPRPLNPLKLRDLAMHYVGRYATSQAKLTAYLQRKVKERGWESDAQAPEVEALTEDFVRLGFVDDAAYAAARARTLTQRGMGLRRVNEDLRAKGISEGHASEAREIAESGHWQAADRFARRKRIGPYAATAAPQDVQQKQLQAFLRAGHGFEIAKKFVRALPGEQLETEDG